MVPGRSLASGTFDLLRSRQVAVLTGAARHGDVYVCIGLDTCVFQMKGQYPVYPRDERKPLIESLRYVTAPRIGNGMGIRDCVDVIQACRGRAAGWNPCGAGGN